MKLIEVRKEDDLYYKGCFWIYSDSVSNIFRNKFRLLTEKIPCSYEGELGRKTKCRTHKEIWKPISDKYASVPYNYYPRGRVDIYKGVAYINIHSSMNKPFIIDRIISEYNLSKLDIEIGLNDIEQGSHYDYLLE